MSTHHSLLHHFSTLTLVPLTSEHLAYDDTNEILVHPSQHFDLLDCNRLNRWPDPNPPASGPVRHTYRPLLINLRMLPWRNALSPGNLGRMAPRSNAANASDGGIGIELDQKKNK